MLTIRNTQLDALGADRGGAFVSRMLAYIRGDFPSRFEELGEQGVRRAIADATAFGETNGVRTEGGIAVLLQLTMMFGPAFERSPDAAWANALLVNQSVPESLRVSMIRDRLTARTGGRSIARHQLHEEASASAAPGG